jgi:peptide deformylase
MAIQTLLKMGDARLLRVAQPVTAFDTDALHLLISDMLDTMAAANGAGLAAPQIGVHLQVVIFGTGQANPRYPDAAVVPRTVLINPVITPLDAHGVPLEGVTYNQLQNAPLERQHFVAAESPNNTAQSAAPIAQAANVQNPSAQGTATFGADYSVLEEGWEGCLSVPGFRGVVQRFKRIRYQGFDQHGDAIDRVAEGFHARVVQHECDHLLGVLYPMRVGDFTRFGFTEVLFPELAGVDGDDD